MSEENTKIISEEPVEEKKKREEPVKEKHEEESTQKKKDPRRVEQGKKLAEWIRKNKTEVPVEKQIDFKLNYWLIGGGALFIIVLYFTNRETKVVPQYVPQIVPQVKTNVPDPFVME